MTLVRHLLLSLLVVVAAAMWPADRVAGMASAASEAHLAVAANFTEVAHVLATDYARQSGNRITLSIGSTGGLYAQIRHGAPFDVFLSADRATPQRLIDERLALSTSLYDYATGRLVLWGRSPTRANHGERMLREHDFRKFAIANPALAPYGAAARAVLQHVGRWRAIQPHLVLGENVAQATQFVLSGNAEAGLLPESLVLQAQQQVGGSFWLVPASWYPPITQSAVLLVHGRNNPAAIGFLSYLRGAAARRIITAHGYN